MTRKSALTRDQKYKLKIKLKRLTSKVLDKKYKKKKALYQANYRRRKKQKLMDEQAMTSSTSFTANDKRKQEGQRRRRANINQLKTENTKLRKRILDLKKQVKQLSLSLQTMNASSSDETPTPSPTKIFISNISPQAKKRATLRMIDKKKSLRRGTITAVREKLGVNLSNEYSPPSTTPSQLAQAVYEFMCRDDISKLCPDKRKQINNQQIRYRLNHLTVLHRQFELETNIDVDYHTFLKYIPPFILKPNVDDWGTCLCMICVNPQMKLDKLHQLKSTKPIIKQLLNSISVDLNEVLNDSQSNKQLKDALHQLKYEKFNVTYNEWQKVKVPKSTSTKSTKVPLVASIEDFLKQFLLEIEYLEKHLERVHQQFKAAKEAKNDAQASKDTATIQIDWAENYNVRQAQEEKGAYYYEQHVSLHSGYVWSHCDTFSFCSISDCTNHMSEAAWCSIKDLLHYLIVDQQKKIIILISDSPTSQYRNKTSIYTLNQYAKEYQILMRWIFLETGHGKGVADAISAQMKRKMDECISFNPDKSYQNASDFFNEIQAHTSIKLYLYNEADVNEVKQQLPRTLKSIKGTAELHEIIAQPNGLVFGKNTSDQSQFRLALKF